MFTKAQLSFLENKKLALACSGGIDSMVLAHLLLSHKVPFSIIHCNFQLRNEASQRDENFVREFAEKNHLNFFAKKFDTQKNADIHKTSIEMEARSLRYTYFEKLIVSEKLDLILLAHHRRDQAETIILRMLKGSGLKGLSGMEELRGGKYFRPLLHVNKEMIIEYATNHQVHFVTDDTNSQNIYQRNKIRNQIFPLFRDINPSYEEAILHFGKISKQVNTLIDDIFSDLLHGWGTNNKIDMRQFMDKDYLPLILSRIFENEISHRSMLDGMVKALESQESKFFTLESMNIELKNGVITKVKSVANTPVNFSDIENLLKTETLRVKTINEPPDSFLYGNLYLDVDKIQFPITFRPIRDGDRINLFGMGYKSRKLSDIAQELRWTVTDKTSNKILVDSENDIIAVLGYRIAEKVKLDKNTKKILIIERPYEIG